MGAVDAGVGAAAGGGRLTFTVGAQPQSSSDPIANAAQRMDRSWQTDRVLAPGLVEKLPSVRAPGALGRILPSGGEHAW